jgi:hypothetical protein
MSVMYCQVEESATGRSLVWRKVLPTVVCLSMISKSQQRRGKGPLGHSRNEEMLQQEEKFD